MKTAHPRIGVARTALAVIAASFIGLPQVAHSFDWQGVADSYGQWTTSTLHTSMMNDALRGQTGDASPQPKPEWPGFTEEDVAGRIFNLAEIEAMRQSDFTRFRGLFDGQMVGIQGKVRRATDTMLWLDDPTASVSYLGKASWRGGTPAFPADGTIIVVRGKVHEVNHAWIELRNPAMLPARNTGAPPAAQAPAQTAQDPTSLTFQRRPEVTAALNQQLASQLSGALRAGRTEAELLEVLNSGQIQEEFRRVLAIYNWSDSDLADVMAAHLIILWQVANRTERETPTGFNAIRDQLRQQLVQAGLPLKLNEAERQLLAETLGTGTTLIALQYNDALRRGISRKSQPRPHQQPIWRSRLLAWIWQRSI